MSAQLEQGFGAAQQGEPASAPALVQQRGSQVGARGHGDEVGCGLGHGLALDAVVERAIDLDRLAEELEHAVVAGRVDEREQRPWITIQGRQGPLCAGQLRGVADAAGWDLVLEVHREVGGAGA